MRNCILAVCPLLLGSKLPQKNPAFVGRKQDCGRWAGGIRDIPPASAAYRWTLSAEDSHLFSTGSRFPDLWINAGPRLLANIAMTYAVGSPFTVTGSFGIPTRFPFTRQWRHCVGYSAVCGSTFPILSRLQNLSSVIQPAAMPASINSAVMAKRGHPARH